LLDPGDIAAGTIMRFGGPRLIAWCDPSASSPKDRDSRIVHACAVDAPFESGWWPRHREEG
jgi:hypothetical protein